MRHDITQALFGTVLSVGATMGYGYVEPGKYLGEDNRGNACSVTVVDYQEEVDTNATAYASFPLTDVVRTVEFTTSFLKNSGELLTAKSVYHTLEEAYETDRLIAQSTLSGERIEQPTLNSSVRMENVFLHLDEDLRLERLEYYRDAKFTVFGGLIGQVENTCSNLVWVSGA